MPTITIPRWLVSLCAAAFITACSDGSDGPGQPDLLTLDAGVTPPPAACDPIVPGYCGFPYPNDYWSVEDASTHSGRRLALPAVIMPLNNDGVGSSPGAFNEMDGFSPGIAAMAHLPGATVAGLATPNTIEASLSP